MRQTHYTGNGVRNIKIPVHLQEHAHLLTYVNGELIIDEQKALEEILRLRHDNYDLGLQVGALMKQANYDRLQGKELIQELDNALGHVQSVKNQYPKPETEVEDDTAK